MSGDMNPVANVLALVLLTSAVAAQGQPGVPSPSNPVAGVFSQATYQRASEGSPSSTEGSQTNSVNVEIGEANGRGLISWKPKDDCSLDKGCWSVKVSAPTSKSSGITDFVTLDGLAKDLTLEAEWSRTALGKGDELEKLFLDELDLVCDVLGKRVDPCDNFTIAKTAGLASVLRQEAETPSTREAEARQEGAKAFLKKVDRFLVSHYQAWSLSGKVSHNQYEYFKLDAAEKKDEQIGLAVKASYARLLGPTTRLSFALEGQRSYEDAKSKAELCNPIEGSATLENCKELPLGEPVRKEALLARVELRHRFGKFIVSPLFSYNFEDDIWGIDLPFYLRVSGDGKTSGGFRVGWRSDQEDLVASIFVSQRVSFLGK